MPQLDDTFISAPPVSLVLEQGFRFHTGEIIAPFTIVYETFGELNGDRSNAILVCHALSPGAHVAGKYTPGDSKAGWWDGMVAFRIRVLSEPASARYPSIFARRTDRRPRCRRYKRCRRR